MKTVEFIKMEGAGNDFIIIEGRKLQATSCKFVKKLCDRKYGIGADGVLLLEKTKKADARMRIFNADGSEANMCGNGARCAAFFIGHKVTKSQSHKKITLETKAGIVEAEAEGDSVRLKMTDPTDLRLGLDIRFGEEAYAVDYVNTGVPHAVLEVQDIEKADVRGIGRIIRYHQAFSPEGTNVDFVTIDDDAHLCIRTYERGVEDETLACGTGSVAVAIIAALKKPAGDLEEARKKPSRRKVCVKTRGGATLAVDFSMQDNLITDVWLKGRVRMICRGEYYV